MKPCLWLSFGLVLGVMIRVSDASADQAISLSSGGDAHRVRITEPEVRRARTPLPITVYKGDRVWVRAGGCVQTGGVGKTWKRYVNPSGPDSWRLYHGQIQIPGAVESLTNLSELVGAEGGWSRQFTVGIGQPDFAPGNIALGYTDDDYEDNGYWGHDPGTEDQCEGVENAWVELYVCRSDPRHGATC